MNCRHNISREHNIYGHNYHHYHQRHTTPRTSHYRPSYPEWPATPPTPPSAPPSPVNVIQSPSSLMLRYQANMMKYQAEVMAREGRMLEIKAQMCEEQEIEAQIHETEQEMAYSRPTQMFRSHPVTIATTTIIEDHHRQTTIKERERFPYNCENFNGIEVVREQEGTSAYEEEQKVFMKKDIKTLTEIVNENPNNSQSLDPQIFKSSVFKEADKLIAGNFHFNSLLKAVGQEIQIQEKIIKEEQDIKVDFDNKNIE